MKPLLRSVFSQRHPRMSQRPPGGTAFLMEKMTEKTGKHNSVAFRESVRKNARDCFEKKGFAGNRHFQGTANFGYLEAIKCHFEARK